MAEQEVTFFGWRLPNPILSAAGPFGANSDVIKRMLDAGAAAVVTKTISHSPEQAQGGWQDYGSYLFNQEANSRLTVQRWEDELNELRGSRVIASVVGDCPEALADLARRVVACGIEVIELGLSCPTRGSDPVCCDLNTLREHCKAARASVDVPLVVKLLLHTSRAGNRAMIEVAKQEGIDGVCIGDTLPAYLPQAQGAEPRLCGHGGLSGAFLKPLVLKAMRDIEDIDIPVIGTGGVENPRDIADYILAGATAVQVCSLPVRRGLAAFTRLVDSFEGWALQKGSGPAQAEGWMPAS